MTVTTPLRYQTLGDYTYHAIKKHLKKIEKWEASVKKDEDPEALHQMRVGMRRLRSVVSSLGFAVELPKSVCDRNIGKIARRLGNLRDLDVLKDILENQYQPGLPREEQKYLQKGLETLAQQRQTHLELVQQLLKSNRYKSLKNDLEDWLLTPIYQPIALISINFSVSDLLLPEVSRFFIHPGWLVGLEIDGEPINGNSESKLLLVDENNQDQLNGHLMENSKVLHHLRKQAKRLRYQMELFTDLYGEKYQNFVNDIKNIQDILGNLQDSLVLEEWLMEIFGQEWSRKLPQLQQIVIATRWEYWQQWQALHAKYMQHSTRESLHQEILDSHKNEIKNPEQHQISI
ncbi:CHAD domain-containing protein [Calothrix sp. NIES-3974]|uniref:CHAD domain-containing protein n=1 Tax=Calothrix sp. NIES-3974 TaxID=2005462 RepID=UPI000B5EF7D4|nr:CHAD domain-containing protein [Calothrix sp. NIES-3974]BAZ06202.1 CHAD domain-containing protein [Calothrix sp. NIES-3974]